MIWGKFYKLQDDYFFIFSTPGKLRQFVEDLNSGE